MDERTNVSLFCIFAGRLSLFVFFLIFAFGPNGLQICMQIMEFGNEFNQSLAGVDLAKLPADFGRHLS